MKFIFRHLILTTLCMAIVGCKAEVGGDFEDGGIQYYPPGPEFKQSRKSEKAQAPAADQLPSRAQHGSNPLQR